MKTPLQLHFCVYPLLAKNRWENILGLFDAVSFCEKKQAIVV